MLPHLSRLDRTNLLRWPNKLNWSPYGLPVSVQSDQSSLSRRHDYGISEPAPSSVFRYPGIEQFFCSPLAVIRSLGQEYRLIVLPSPSSLIDPYILQSVELTRTSAADENIFGRDTRCACTVEQ